jgi:hypothetical protein
MALAQGTRVGRYRIEGVLGRGGMAVVYRARGEGIDRDVALKLLADDLSAAPEFVERFRREGRLQASLEHPHAVTIYEAGDSDYGLYLAMRLVPGPTLAELNREHELGAAQTLTLLGQVADALDAAHALGLVHRDVKPQNVLVSGDDAYLGDFGLTRVEDATGVTSTGRLMGTVAYLAPEVIQGQQAGPAADRYAFAAMLFECLTGSAVFPRGTQAAVLFAHTNERVPRISARRPELPRELDDIFDRALAKDPRARPDSAGGLVDEVRRVLEAAGLAELGPPPLHDGALDSDTIASVLPRRPLAAARRSALPWFAAALVVGAALALGIRALVADGGGPARAQAAVPEPLPGAVVLGSDLSHPGRTLDCHARPPRPGARDCTMVQTALPGHTVFVPSNGVIRRWSVRSARGELSLAVLRPRSGGAGQIARSQSEFAENDGVFVFPTDIQVERGDLVGVVVIEGGLGARAGVEGAMTERWIPHVGATRAPDFPAGSGWNDELLLRVELMPGRGQRQPQQVSGTAALHLPPGRVQARRRGHFADGHPYEIALVAIGGRTVLDEFIDGRRRARVDLPGFRAQGQLVSMSIDIDPSSPENLGVYIQYVNAESSRLLAHYYGAGDHGFEIVN